MPFNPDKYSTQEGFDPTRYSGESTLSPQQAFFTPGAMAKRAVDKKPSLFEPTPVDVTKESALSAYGKMALNAPKVLGAVAKGIISGEMGKDILYRLEENPLSAWNITKETIIDPLTNLAMAAHGSTTRIFNREMLEPFGLSITDLESEEKYIEKINQIFTDPTSPVLAALMGRGGLGALAKKGALLKDYIKAPKPKPKPVAEVKPQELVKEPKVLVGEVDALKARLKQDITVQESNIVKSKLKKLKVEPVIEAEIPKAKLEPIAERVSYKEAIKKPDRPEMTNMETYYKTISMQKKLTPEQALKSGIALRTTKGGKIKPAVRRAGTFVSKEFAEYGMKYNQAVKALDRKLYADKITQKQYNKQLKKIEGQYPYHFKDAKQGVGGGTKDWIRFVQEIDGALSKEKKAKLPKQMGPAEENILRRTEDIMMIEMDWAATQTLRIRDITKGLNDKQQISVTRVLEETSRPGAFVETANFANNSRIRNITTDSKIVKAAQETRKLLEHIFSQENKLRALRNQELIDYRQYYAPQILKETSLWEKAFGNKVKPKEIMQGPQLPDYIKPNQIFNKHALAREIGLPDHLREMRIGKILEDYANTASRDIHHTSIIQNNKAFIQQLETMGYKNAAEGLSNFTAEGFGGIKARLDRALDFPTSVRKGMRFWRGSLMRSIFPLNISWNTAVQTLSSALTVMREGVTSSTQGLVDWFANPTMRNRIKQSFSYRVKAQKAGRITRQDINTGVTQMVSGKRSAWQAAIDGTNYVTELVERNLTGWSIASGLRRGAKKGLKGKSLWDYASDSGAKSQSMYNRESKPGMLRSEGVQTAFPLQTFVFEMYNTAKEFAGKTGTPPGTMAERVGWALRFTAMAYAGNEMANALTGRRPWDVYSFIPFSDQLIKPVVDALRGKSYEAVGGRGQISFVGAGVQFSIAVRSYLKTGDTRKLRNWGLRYGTAFMKIPGGTQIARMVDGWIAVANEGLKDTRGRTLFKIKDPLEQARAISMGPWRTKAGIEYWDERETGLFEDLGISEKAKEEIRYKR